MVVNEDIFAGSIKQLWGASTVPYSPEFGKFIKLGASDRTYGTSAVIAVIAAAISRLMPVIGALAEIIKNKYKEDCCLESFSKRRIASIRKTYLSKKEEPKTEIQVQSDGWLI